MAETGLFSGRSRIASAVAAATVHLLLGFALITGLGFRPATDGARDRLQIFDLAWPPPPQILEQASEPEPAQAKEVASGVPAAPAAPAAQASPVVAPSPRIRLEAPPPVAAAPVPQLGSAILPGIAPLPGTGGSGGEGQGTGAGGSGPGSGSGGGPAVRTRRISGGFTNADYPRAAERIGAQGRVVARLTVAPDGRVSNCAVRISSGHEALDTTTCRLILSRFRFEPARDASGVPVAETVEWEQIWSLEPEGDPRVAEAVCRGRAVALPRAARRDALMSCMAEFGWTR
jgi:periplasmic protein TonB